MPPAALFSDAVWIIRRLKEKGFSAYLVGGCVRDLLAGHPTHDFDITTAATSEELRQIFPKTVSIGKSFDTTLVVLGHRPYQITTFQDNRGTLQRDFAPDILRRDFTINAIFWDPTEDRMIDLVHGIRDLRAGILKTVSTPAATFENDPIRMLRAIRIAFQFGLRINPDILPEMKSLRQLIGRVSPDRIHQELVSIFSLSPALPPLCPLIRTGLLYEIIPELKGLAHLKQGRYHDFSALSHTFRCIGFTDLFYHHPRKNGRTFSHSSLPFWMLSLAALLHDIGKPETLQIISGRTHFYGHEETGAETASTILRRLHFSKKESRVIRQLIQRHLYPLHLYQRYRQGDLTKRAIDRFQRNTKEFKYPLLTLATADQAAKRRLGTKALPDTWFLFCKKLLENEK
jgi:putative nucleotidyltransferase with HDIG domain